VFSGLPALPGTIQFASATATFNEGTGATLSVTRTGGTAGALSVNFATVSGTAGTADFTAAAGTLSWANGDAGTKTITVPTTTDALTEGTETFTVNLGQPLLGGALLGGTQSTGVRITDPGSATPYDTWRTAHFTAAELANAAVSGPHADPDNDGWENFLEYATGTLPKTANASPLNISSVSANTVVLTYLRNSTATDVTVSFEHSTSLAGATWVPVTLSGDNVNSSSGGVEVHAATFARGAASRDFFRLKATIIP
jgi:hypothetical protein